ncbi:hypothetical protein [Candidatus Hodarchaeum mangrovi]
MAEYQDFGQYLMKLFDPLISESKQQIMEAREEYLREMPRRFASRTTISVSNTETCVKEIADKILRINQDLLNNYSIEISKKARSQVKKHSDIEESEIESLKGQLTKREQEFEGLRSKIKILENQNTTLESEKAQTLQQLSQMTKTINELNTKLNSSSAEFNKQINILNTEWETRFRKNQEEWDSYVKLKLAEKEVKSAITDNTSASKYEEE